MSVIITTDLTRHMAELTGQRPVIRKNEKKTKAGIILPNRMDSPEAIITDDITLDEILGRR